MGLIKAAVGATLSTLKDSWKDYFTCESLSNEVLVSRGQKHTSSLFSKDDSNVITNGSGIVVNEGQCIIIVDNGQVVEFSAEPGLFTYDKSAQPSLFGGNLAENLKATFEEIKNRFVTGGIVGTDQRVYYFNTKEILDNKFGTANPIPFRVVDKRIDLDLDCSIRLAGQYTYRIVDPVLFFTNVCGNVSTYYNAELEVYLNEALSAKWAQFRGIKVVNVAISTVTLPEDQAQAIADAQKAVAYANSKVAAGGLVDAQIQAMKDAAKNSAGAAVGFMGLNAAQSAGGVNVNNLFTQAQSTTRNNWTCSCGTVNTGNFCSNCGKKKEDGSWTCSCGTVNTGNFCSNCGSKKPQ